MLDTAGWLEHRPSLLCSSSSGISALEILATTNLLATLRIDVLRIKKLGPVISL